MKKRKIKKLKDSLEDMIEAIKELGLSVSKDPFPKPIFVPMERVFNDIFMNFTILFEKVNEICICLNLAPIPIKMRDRNDPI